VLAGATSTTFALESSKTKPDGHFVGQVAHIVSGTGAGQQRVVTASTGSTGVCTTTAWTTTPDVTSVVEIWSRMLAPDQVNDALNLALLGVHDVVNVRVDQTVVYATDLDATRHTRFTLPSTFIKVIDVLVKTTADMYTRYLPVEFGSQGRGHDFWFTVGPGRTVMLSHAPGSSDTILARGYRLPAEMTADADLCEVWPDYLVHQAGYLLEAADTGGTLIDPEQHAGRAANWMREAMIRRSSIATIWEPYTQEVGI